MTAGIDLLRLDGSIAGLINNKLFKTTSTFPVIDPNNELEKVLHEVYGVNSEEAVEAVEAAAAALPSRSWRPFGLISNVIFLGSLACHALFQETRNILQSCRHHQAAIQRIRGYRDPRDDLGQFHGCFGR